MDKCRPVNRRHFLGATAAGLAAVSLPRPARAASAERISCGFIGVGGRGGYLLSLMLQRKDVDVVAVCDVAPERVRWAQSAVVKSGQRQPAGFGEHGPDDYRRMLERKDLVAVVVATPMEDHARMSVDALRAGKAVLSEVAAATTLKDCWALVKAVEQTGTLYMLAENVCYYRELMAVGNMVRKGVFGELTYGECGYVHDCRAYDFAADGSLTWRGLQTRDEIGNRYPTHAIGPMAQWMGIGRSDRFVSLVAMSSRQAGVTYYAREKFGTDSPQARAEYKKGDSTTCLIRTAEGAVIDLRYDTSSARPVRSTTYHNLQGEKASYESGRNEIWIEGRSKAETWEPLSKYAAEYEDEQWKRFGKEASESGHGGADFFVLKDFFDTLRSGRPSPIDVYDAAVWSAIIPLSVVSLEKGSAAVEFPDFCKGRSMRAPQHGL